MCTVLSSTYVSSKWVLIQMSFESLHEWARGTTATNVMSKQQWQHKQQTKAHLNFYGSISHQICTLWNLMHFVTTHCCCCWWWRWRRRRRHQKNVKIHENVLTATSARVAMYFRLNSQARIFDMIIALRNNVPTPTATATATATSTATSTSTSTAISHLHYSDNILLRICILVVALL